MVLARLTQNMLRLAANVANSWCTAQHLYAVYHAQAYLPLDGILEALVVHSYWQVPPFIEAPESCVGRVFPDLEGTCIRVSISISTSHMPKAIGRSMPLPCSMCLEESPQPREGCQAQHPLPCCAPALLALQAFASRNVVLPFGVLGGSKH